MKYIKITNNGEIDINAFFLMGASTKRNQDKIGFFGSGLKYAIAVLLRNGIGIRAFSGVNEIKITTRKTKFRDQTFNKICFNGKETGLTIEMGVDWEPWFPIREVYCNALDEGGCAIEVVDEVVPDFDKTSFFIEMNQSIQKVFDNWNKYFSNKRQDIVMIHDDVKVYEGGDDYVIYRKGVACHQEKRKSLFHYDINHIEINESRTLKHSIDSTWRVAEVLKQCANKDVIMRILDQATPEHVEWFMHWDVGTFNEAWLDVIGNRRLIKHEVSGHFKDEQAKGNCLILSTFLIRALKSQFGKQVVVVGEVGDNCGFTILNKTEKQDNYIKESLDFLKKSGYEIEYPIEVCSFQDDGILGQAVGKKILISEHTFQQGKKKVTETIYEEFLHIKHGFSDCSRDMQEHLFNQIISMMEEKIGVYF